MKLTIFGATGGSGKQLIEQALAEGHAVVAFARHPAKLTLHHEHLTIVQGELHDLAKIERAVNGAEVVISVLGPRPGETPQTQPLTQGMRNIITAMKKFSVRRLIVVSTPSARAPNDLPDWKFKILVFLIQSMLRPAYEEIVNVAQLVRTSELDWTIVRVPGLNNHPPSGKVRVGYLGTGEVGIQLSRADLAGFILDELKTAKYIRHMPALSN